ncbi:MAG: class I mannose-6-phosphate isomerase [Oscillospiraceae bacterium]|nr:class I mannose-6-phosphate isomerase [Oscillospiraceae bacterium]
MRDVCGQRKDCLYPMLLKPALKNYIWGGSRLKSEFSVESEDAIVAEAWMLSCNPAGESTIINGSLAGKTLAEVLFSDIDHSLGRKMMFSAYFPILIKLIDAENDLSVQVHPGNGYALEKEGRFGKTEMWYVLDARKGANIYYGFSRPISKNELIERIERNTLPDVLNRVIVRPGDVFLIEPGTVHAIGAGILVAEIQQNSDATYRIFDYDRTDSSGKKRELHIEEALEVINTGVTPGSVKSYSTVRCKGYSVVRLASCPYFSVDLVSVDTQADLCCGSESFTSLLLIEGEGRILFGNKAAGTDGIMDVRKGDSVFLPANTGDYRIQGKCRALRTVR